MQSCSGNRRQLQELHDVTRDAVRQPRQIADVSLVDCAVRTHEQIGREAYHVEAIDQIVVSDDNGVLNVIPLKKVCDLFS